MLQNFYQTAPRLFLGLLGLVSLIPGDHLVARLTYRQNLLHDVNQKKQSVLSGYKQKDLEMCKDVKENATYDHDACRTICISARDLSGIRRQLLLKVRKRHPLSTQFAQIFDFLRSVDQHERTDYLMKKKSCLAVIKSTDKSNFLVDYFCAAILCCFYFAGYLILQNAPELHLELWERLDVMLKTMFRVIPLWYTGPLWCIVGIVIAVFIPEHHLSTLITPYNVVKKLILKMKFALGILFMFTVLWSLVATLTKGYLMYFHGILFNVLAVSAAFEGGIMVYNEGGKPAPSQSEQSPKID